MKSIKNVLAVLIVVGLSGFMMAGACEDGPSGLTDGVCGECGTVSNGDATITGMAQLDGIFKAVGTMKMRTGSIKGDFDARVRAIAEGVFDLDVSAMSTAEVVAAIETAFDAWISANVDGGISVSYQPPKCEANVDVAVSAQAQCEAKAGCDVEVECEPGQASFECSGKCEGSCSAECTVPTCTVKIEGSAECSGECQGSCTVEVDGSVGCDGKCSGECDGECSAYNAEGSCNGTCSGTCNGSCTMEGQAAMECSGSCSGECKAEVEADATCEGTAGCSGECSGSCEGSCKGEVKAPKCEGNADCDASADCEAQASAQASASLTCTPPSLSLDVAFAAGLDAGAKAEFMAKLEKFKVEMIGILQGTANLRALVDADYAAELGFESPVVTIGASVDAFLSDLTSGKIEVEAPGLLPCAIPAFQEAGDILGSIGGDASATIEGQIKMAALLKL